MLLRAAVTSSIQLSPESLKLELDNLQALGQVQRGPENLVSGVQGLGFRDLLPIAIAYSTTRLEFQIFLRPCPGKCFISESWVACFQGFRRTLGFGILGF